MKITEIPEFGCGEQTEPEPVVSGAIQARSIAREYGIPEPTNNWMSVYLIGIPLSEAHEWMEDRYGAPKGV